MLHLALKLRFIYNHNFGDSDDQFSLLLLVSLDIDNVDNDDSESENNYGRNDDGYIHCLPALLLASNDNDNLGNDGDNNDNYIEDNDDSNDGYIAHQFSFLLLASGRGVCLVVELCHGWTSSLVGEQVALQMLRDCLVSKL